MNKKQLKEKGWNAESYIESYLKFRAEFEKQIIKQNKNFIIEQLTTKDHLEFLFNRDEFIYKMFCDWYNIRKEKLKGLFGL